jgi:hypothetical protein
MTSEDKQIVLDTIECEGFDYAFAGYSDFPQIEDKEFHEKRRAYLKARQDLAELIGFEVDR